MVATSLVFIGPSGKGSEFRLEGWTYLNFHINGYVDEDFDPQVTPSSNMMALHITGKCPSCGGDLHITIKELNEPGPEELWYEGFSRNCIACMDFAAYWDPFMVAVVSKCENLKWGPWYVIVDYPFQGEYRSPVDNSVWYTEALQGSWYYGHVIHRSAKYPATLY